MKNFLVVISFVVSFSAYSSDMKLSEYDWNLTDILSKGFTKESFFQSMDRNFIKVSSSICSNRALLWAYDFKRKFDIDSAKIFLFYTKKTGEVGRKTWWYHVAPVVNANNEIVVMDAGFPRMIRGPQTRDEWLHSFIGSTQCKEIKAGENELIERMFRMTVFPSTTTYGTFDCYYRIVPGSFWTPETVAMNLLGRNAEGIPVQFERPEIDLDEVFQACVEATTTRFGRVFGGGKKECEELVGRN